MEYVHFLEPIYVCMCRCTYTVPVYVCVCNKDRKNEIFNIWIMKSRFICNISSFNLVFKLENQEIKKIIFLKNIYMLVLAGYPD